MPVASASAIFKFEFEFEIKPWVLPPAIADWVTYFVRAALDSVPRPPAEACAP